MAIATLTQVQAPSEPGLYPDVDADEYRRWPLASQSILKILRDRSPAHAREAMLNPPEPTPALRLGEAVHMAVLQPDLFMERYVVAPEVDRRTKAGREAWEEFLAEHESKRILTSQEWAQCIAMRDAVRSHSIASKLLWGEAEVSAVWRDPDTGVMCKGRFDDIARGIGALVDLKTTMDASKGAFTRAIYEFGYYIQAAMYLRGAQTLGLNVKFFTFIAVEKTPPYGVAVYHVRDDAIDAGVQELRPLLETFARCQQTGRWPGYAEEAVEISLPPWAWSQIEERVS